MLTNATDAAETNHYQEDIHGELVHCNLIHIGVQEVFQLRPALIWPLIDCNNGAVQ